MKVSYETAERVAEYYCELRALEDNNDTSEPEWNLTEEEDKILGLALEEGLCDYFSAEDVIEVLG